MLYIKRITQHAIVWNEVYKPGLPDLCVITFPDLDPENFIFPKQWCSLSLSLKHKNTELALEIWQLWQPKYSIGSWGVHREKVDEMISPSCVWSQYVRLVLWSKLRSNFPSDSTSRIHVLTEWLSLVAVYLNSLSVPSRFVLDGFHPVPFSGSLSNHAMFF